MRQLVPSLYTGTELPEPPTNTFANVDEFASVTNALEPAPAAAAVGNALARIAGVFTILADTIALPTIARPPGPNAPVSFALVGLLPTLVAVVSCIRPFTCRNSTMRARFYLLTIVCTLF